MVFSVFHWFSSDWFNKCCPALWNICTSCPIVYIWPVISKNYKTAWPQTGGTKAVFLTPFEVFPGRFPLQHSLDILSLFRFAADVRCAKFATFWQAVNPLPFLRICPLTFCCRACKPEDRAHLPATHLHLGDTRTTTPKYLCQQVLSVQMNFPETDLLEKTLKNFNCLIKYS